MPGLRVLDAAARFGIALQIDVFDFANCDYCGGVTMPSDWKERIGGHDAIFFSAPSAGRRAPTVALWGSLLKFRRDFDQYVNLRPARLMPGSARRWSTAGSRCGPATSTC